MATQSDHMEVAPRMWDKSLAASRIVTPVKSNVAEDSFEMMHSDPIELNENGSSVIEASTTLFSKLKTYLLPAIFVICILVIVYVGWTYFTKYRNKKVIPADVIEHIDESDIKAIDDNPLRSAMDIINSEDTSKYEYDSDTTEEEQIKRLSPINEEEEKDEDEDEEEEEEEEE